MKRALISVTNKDGVVDFAKGLVELGFEIVSTGGTMKVLQENGVSCIAIDDVTGFPEMLDGRVKTLHPMVHGGLLYRRDLPSHVETIKKHGIHPIDLVCVNLYEFEKALKAGKDLPDMIENIDIGGPSMIRSAAKNFKDVLIVTDPKDYVDDVKEVMARKKYRDFPVVDINGDFQGFISRRRLLNCRKKQVILVDHNEESQAVDGIEQADVLEIIDHHRLNSIQTIGPVVFRNQPVGCTATIIYQMYQEYNKPVNPVIAGLLCSAIISDTLLFRSPTCTLLDEDAAKELAEIAGINMKELAQAMFKAGSNLQGKSAEEICFLDFKQFTVNDTVFGVGQVNSMSAKELTEIKTQIESELDKIRQNHRLDMIFFMLTNIMTESSELLCVGPEAREKAISAFDLNGKSDTLYLKGVVSRKKQLVPAIVETLQQ